VQNTGIFRLEFQTEDLIHTVGEIPEIINEDPSKVSAEGLFLGLKFLVFTMPFMWTG
jgi:hypothetical protein